MVGFDEYERKARLTPGLLTIAPLTILIATLGLKAYPAVATAGAVVVAAGGSFALAVLVRHLGRELEPALWDSWGGSPTTSRLRTRDPSDNSVLRSQRRAAIQQFTGISLLDQEQEARDPAAADEHIVAAVHQVRRLGQDDRYPLIRQENIHYGFERNLYGVRWVGRGVSAVCVLTLLGVLLVSPPAIGDTKLSSAAVAAGLALDVAFLLAWCLIPSLKRTRLAADRYAEQLLQAVVIEARTDQGAVP